MREDESVVVHLPVQEYPERRVVNDYPYAGKRRRLDYDLDAAEAALAAKPTLELVPELVLPPEAAPRPALVIAWKHVLHVGLTIATRGKWLPVYLLVVLRDRRRRQAATRVG